MVFPIDFMGALTIDLFRQALCSVLFVLRLLRGRQEFLI